MGRGFCLDWSEIFDKLFLISRGSFPICAVPLPYMVTGLYKWLCYPDRFYVLHLFLCCIASRISMIGCDLVIICIAEKMTLYCCNERGDLHGLLLT